MNLSKIFLFIIIVLPVLIGCDTKIKGDLMVFNDSDKNITVKYYTINDSVSKELRPGDTEIVAVMDDYGSNKSAAGCCPCYGGAGVKISSLSGPIKKDPSNRANWEVPNKRKLRRSGGDPVKCQFHVKQEDL